MTRVLQYLNNISNWFRSILAILQYFQRIFLEYFLNLGSWNKKNQKDSNKIYKYGYRRNFNYAKILKNSKNTANLKIMM